MYTVSYCMVHVYILLIMNHGSGDHLYIIEQNPNRKFN